MPANDLLTAANELRTYLYRQSPRQTRALARSWTVGGGKLRRFVFSRVPWSWRIRGDNRKGIDVLDNALRYMRRRHSLVRITYTQTYGRIRFTLSLVAAPGLLTTQQRRAGRRRRR